MNVHIAGRGNLGQDSSVAPADLIKLSRGFVSIEARAVRKSAEGRRLRQASTTRPRLQVCSPTTAARRRR